MTDLLIGILLGAAGTFPLGYAWGLVVARRRAARQLAQTRIPLQQRVQQNMFHARPLTEAEMEGRWARDGKTQAQEYGYRALRAYPVKRQK